MTGEPRTFGPSSRKERRKLTHVDRRGRPRMVDVSANSDVAVLPKRSCEHQETLSCHRRTAPWHVLLWRAGRGPGGQGTSDLSVVLPSRSRTPSSHPSTDAGCSDPRDGHGGDRLEMSTHAASVAAPRLRHSSGRRRGEANVGSLRKRRPSGTGIVRQGQTSHQARPAGARPRALERHRPLPHRSGGRDVRALVHITTGCVRRRQMRASGRRGVHAPRIRRPARHGARRSETSVPVAPRPVRGGLIGRRVARAWVPGTGRLKRCCPSWTW